MTDVPGGGMPSPEDGRALYARLLAGDAPAPADFAAAYLDPLAARLQARNPRVTDPHFCTVAAGEAIIALIKNPHSYDPARRSLAGYLLMSAQGDLRNLLRQERRHSARRADWEAVELSPLAGKYLWDANGDPARIVDQHEEAAPPPALPGLTDRELAVLALMREGERKTAVYARVLGITQRPIEEQRQLVKREKDRLQKRLARSADPTRAPR